MLALEQQFHFVDFAAFQANIGQCDHICRAFRQFEWNAIFTRRICSGAWTGAGILVWSNDSDASNIPVATRLCLITYDDIVGHGARNIVNGECQIGSFAHACKAWPRPCGMSLQWLLTNDNRTILRRENQEMKLSASRDSRAKRKWAKLTP